MVRLQSEDELFNAWQAGSGLTGYRPRRLLRVPTGCRLAMTHTGLRRRCPSQRRRPEQEETSMRLFVTPGDWKILLPDATQW